MQPIVNNFDLPKPADENTLSQNQGDGVSSEPVNLPGGLTMPQVLKYSKSRNSTWESWFKPKFDKIKANHRLWRNAQTNIASRVGNSPIPLPVGYAILESVCARLVTTLTSRPKFVEAVADQILPDNSGQEDVEDFINQNLLAEWRKPEKGKYAVKSSMLDGYVICRSEWKREIVEDATSETKQDPATGQTVEVGTKSVQRMKEYWTLRKCDPSNCAWDIHTTTKVQDSPWFRERDFWSYNEMLQKQSRGEIEGVERLKTIVPSGLKGTQKEDFEVQLKKADGDGKWTETYSDEKLYQIDEWYAYLTYTDEDGKVKTVNAHYFVCENEHLLSFEENVLKPCRIPYISAQGVQQVDAVMGLPLLEAVKDLLNSINTYAGKQQALVEWCSNPTIFYGNKSGLAGRTTFNRPMGMQPVMDATDIKEFLGNPDSVKVVQDYLAFLIAQARECSGANEQFQGIDGSRTATEFQGLQAAAGSRFADIAENLNQGLLEPLAQECYWFYRQFGVDGQMVFHPQTEEAVAHPITRSQLQPEFRFVATTASSDNYRQRQIADDTQFLGMMDGMNQKGGFPSVGPNGQPHPLLYNIPKHVEEISIPLRGQKSSKDMFTPAPPPPQVMLSAEGKPIPVPPGGFVNMPGGNQGIPMNMRAGQVPTPGQSARVQVGPVSATPAPTPPQAAELAQRAQEAQLAGAVQ